MAEIDKSIVEFEDLFQDLFVRILGWDADSPDGTNNVRIAWQQEGAPAWKIGANMVFISALPQDSPINRQHDVILEDGVAPVDINVRTGMTRVMMLNCILYGSESMANANKLKLGMFHPLYRQELALENIYYVPDTVEPRREPENFQGQWWERVNMQLYFNQLVVKETAINEITEVEVTTIKEDGVEGEIIINK